MPGLDLFGEVFARIAHDLARHPPNNICSDRYPGRPTRWERVSNWMFRASGFALNKLHLAIHSPYTVRSAARNFRELTSRSSGLNHTFGLLADEPSRNTLIEVMAYRTLGSDHVKLALNNEKYRSDLKYISSHLEKEKIGIRAPILKTELRRYDLNPLGFPIIMLNLALGIHTIFMVKQYAYDLGGITIGASGGDVVIDGGGCWGETAIYFAHKIGPQGRVYSFEFEPGNLELYRRNLLLNPTLAPRIDIIERALWDRPDVPLGVTSNGPGTSVGEETTAGHIVRTETIDRLVETGQIDRVDFIKLDIEGAEFPTLKGAEQTLRRFRPKMAVALYHSLDDFVRIPKYLDELGLGYRFYLRHCTIYGEETVLYVTT